MISRLREWGHRLWGTFRSGDGGIDEELRFHLEMAEQDAQRRGESAREARLRAGGTAQAAEAVRDQGSVGWLADFFRDTRHGIRLLGRSPFFTAFAIASLALGIGANTAIFSLMDAVMLRMMPVHEPGRLVQFVKSRGDITYDISCPLFHQLREELRGFDGVFAHAPMGRREVIFGDEPEAVNAELVSGSYYSVLGVPAVAGRVFDEKTDRNPSPVAVISHAFWKRRFGMDPGVVGRTFRLNRTVFTIIGVTPPEFYGVIAGAAPEITFPLTMDGEVRGGESWFPYNSRSWLSMMGRLGREQHLENARAEVDGIFSRIVQDEWRLAAGAGTREREGILSQRMRLEPAGNGLNVMRKRFSEPLRLLMGMVALVLLIACANLANLLLGRAATRRREIAVRLAMGAGGGRVIRQMLAEGLLLAAAGGVLGVLLACWAANALVTMMSNGGERLALNIQPDLRVLAFTAAVSVAACLLFSLAPAMQAARQRIQPALAEARGVERWSLGRVFIAGQVAISVLLLIGAGLFGRTLLHLHSMETGFESDGVTLFSVNADWSGLQGHELRNRVLEGLQPMPGVTAASFAMWPISHRGWEASVRVEGYTHAPDERDMAHHSFVAADYFKTMRTPVILGREFGERDTETSPKVAVVNETFMRRYFDGRSPLGKWVNVAGEPDRMEIVGVVKDIRSRSLRGEVPPTLFTPVAQREDPPAGTYILRGKVNAAIIATALQRIDAKLRIVDPRTLDEHLSRSILSERMLGTLAGFFGALALLLVCAGVYGVMAFQVARRLKEIGIRMALGARPVQVTGMVLAETALPVAAGIGAGIAGALALTHLAEKILFGVKPTDPATFAGACILLATLALIAAYLPSRMAARVNPVETLRCE